MAMSDFNRGAANAKATTDRLAEMDAATRKNINAVSGLLSEISDGRKTVAGTEKDVKQAVAEYQEQSSEPVMVDFSGFEPESGRKQKIKNLILRFATSANERKLAKEESKAERFVGIISERESHIAACEKEGGLLAFQIDKLRQRIEDLRNVNELSTGIKGLFSGLIRKKNEIEISRCETKILDMESQIDVIKSEIGLSRAEISHAEYRLDLAVEAAKEYQRKIDLATEIDRAGLPNQATTYFLCDRLNIEADELNEVFQNPKAYLEARRQNDETLSNMSEMSFGNEEKSLRERFGEYVRNQEPPMISNEDVSLKTDSIRPKISPSVSPNII